MKPSAILWALAAVVLLAFTKSGLALEPTHGVRLYALDCGRLDFKDMSFFSDTGEYDGMPGSIVDPCFLIRHPRGVLLWDTGLGDALVGHDEPPNAAGVSMHAGVRLLDQLSSIGIKPADVTFLAFSHFHQDHTGNANAFVSATWILSRTELDWALATPTPPVVNLQSFSAYRTAATRIIDGDYDVFGDGTVRILKTPGHTPGHQSLMLRLSSSGFVVLSGDLYHLRSDRQHGTVTGVRVMTLNTNRADTLASIDRIERILKNTHGRLIIQHDPIDFRSLPQFPAYLE